jgi:hypothetical protein
MFESVPEFIDAVFGKTSTKLSFSVMQNERIGVVNPKTGSINLGTENKHARKPLFFCGTPINFP